MTAHNQDARLRQGETATLLVNISNPSDLVLTDASCRYLIAPSSMGGDPLYSTSADLTINPDNSATALVTIDGENTASLESGWYHHELNLLMRTGYGGVCMAGQLRLDPMSLGLPRPTLAVRTLPIRLEGRL